MRDRKVERKKLEVGRNFAVAVAVFENGPKSLPMYPSYSFVKQPIKPNN